MRKERIPNCITVFRMFLLPAFVAVFWLVPEKRWAFGIFVLASLSDLLDGFLARRWNAVSDFGKVMDPLADKLMQVAAIVCLALWWPEGLLLPAIVIFTKEGLMVLGGVTLFRRKRLVVYSNTFGKAAAFLFNLVICLVFLRDVWFSGQTGLQILRLVVILTVGLSVLAMYQYGLIALYRPEKYLEHKEREE